MFPVLLREVNVLSTAVPYLSRVEPVDKCNLLSGSRVPLSIPQAVLLGLVSYSYELHHEDEPAALFG